MVNHPKLTKRQLECLRGVADHLDSQQISVRLGISPHTVDRHIEAAIATLRARSCRDAVRMLREAHSELLTSEFLPVAGPAEPDHPRTAKAVREEYMPPFDFGEMPIPDMPEPGGTEHHDLRPLRTILLVVAIAVGIAVLLIAVEPLTNSARNLANDIQPYRHR